MDERTKELIDIAAQSFYDAAFADGAAQADAKVKALEQAHAAEITELRNAHAAELTSIIAANKTAVQAAYDSGYAKGHADAAQETPQPATPEPEPQTPEPANIADVSAVVNLENDAVRRYMSEVDYTGYATGNGQTKVRDYIAGIPDSGVGDPQGWGERPRPIIIGEAGDVVRLSRDGVTREFAGGAEILNLTPQTSYDCEVLRGGVVTGRGTIKTEGVVRMLAFETESCIYNARDLGGYECTGGRVRYGRVLRSSFLQNTLTKDSANAKILRDDLGVNLEIGLGYAVREGCGWNTAQYGIYSYAPILTNTKNVKNVINAIADNLSKGCTLIHCFAGADRTGTIAAILLALLGVSESDIIKDWELTSFCCWHNIKGISDEDANKAEFPQGELRTFLRTLMKYNGDTLRDKTEYWLTKKVGVTASTIAAIRAALVE